MKITMTAVSTLDELVRWFIDPRTIQVRLWLPVGPITGFESLVTGVSLRAGRDPVVTMAGGSGVPEQNIPWAIVERGGRLSVTYEDNDVGPAMLDVMEVLPIETVMEIENAQSCDGLCQSVRNN